MKWRNYRSYETGWEMNQWKLRVINLPSFSLSVRSSQSVCVRSIAIQLVRDQNCFQNRFQNHGRKASSRNTETENQRKFRGWNWQAECLSCTCCHLLGIFCLGFADFTNVDGNAWNFPGAHVSHEWIGYGGQGNAVLFVCPSFGRLIRRMG